MIIATFEDKILFNSEECEVPDFWPFKLMNAVFGDSQAFHNAYLPGIYEAVNSLYDREKIVLLMVFKDHCTRKEIGDVLECSAERVRQIEAKALRKLRHPARSKKMLAVSKAEFNQIEADKNLAMVELNHLKNNDVPIEQMSVLIENLDLSVRAFNCLKRAGINTLGDIEAKGAHGLIRVRNIGRKAFNEVVDKVNSLGITLEGLDEVMEEIGGSVNG